MPAIPFDTVKSVDALEAAKMSREQARAIVELVRSSHDAADVATKGDLSLLQKDLKNDVELLRTEMKGELTLLKWMLGVLITGVAGLLVRAFFMT